MALILWAIRDIRLSLPLAWLAIATIAIANTALTRDYLVYMQTVWRAADSAVVAGAREDQVDAGAGWDGYHLYTDGLEAGLTRARTRHGRWWTNFYGKPTDSSYVVSSKPLKDYVIIGEYHYHTWLPDQMRTLFSFVDAPRPTCPHSLTTLIRAHGHRGIGMTDPTATANHNRDSILIIIARAPIPGHTKTRLGATIGMRAASILHEAFIADIAECFNPDRLAFRLPSMSSGAIPRHHLIFSSYLRGLLPNGSSPASLAQPDLSFADRLTWLFHWAVGHGYRRTIIMASDSPHLTVPMLTKGSISLQGPISCWGGLRMAAITLSECGESSSIFSTNRSSSTCSAADGLIAAAQTYGLSIAEAEASFDIDTEDDLQRLHALLVADPARAPKTHAALIGLGLPVRWLTPQLPDSIQNSH